MPIVADAAAAVRADMSPFHRDLKAGLDKGGKQIDTLGTRLKGALTPGNLLAAGGIGFGLAQTISVLSDATNAAAEFQDSVSATGVIFGEEMIPQMEAWGDSAHENFGASKQDAIAAANVIATLGKSAGLAGQDLVNFSQEMVQLGGDLASMFGGTTQDAITAVSAALRGESEPIRRYGVLLDDATLRQKAFEMGIIDTTKNALTPQQRVLAAQASILEQTTDAQGDFVRTSDGMANMQRDLQAQIENVNIEIGEKMLPIMKNLVDFVNDVGIPVMREFMDLLDFGNTDSAQDIPVLGQIEDFLNGVAAAGPRLNDHITGNFSRIVDAADKVGISYEDMRRRIRTVMEQTGVDHEEAVRRVTLAWTEGTGELAQTIPQNIKHATADVGTAATEMAQQIPDAMETAKAEAEEVARSTPGALGDSLRAGLDEYQDDLDELADMAENSVSDLAERQEIEGILASQELTDALNSDSTRTRLKAIELVTDLIDDYELLAPGALDSGSLVNPNLQTGIESNLNLATEAGNAVVDAAGNPLVELGPLAYGWGSEYSRQFMLGMGSYWQRIRNTAISLGEAAAVPLRFRSPPVMGPLKESDKWGGMLGQLLEKGMLGSVPGLEGASMAMASAAAPSLGIGQMGAVPAMSTAAGGGPTYILQVEGREKVVGSREEVLAAWEQMASFDGGPR